MVIIHAHLTVKPEHVDEFVAKSKALVAGSQAEAGNISYDFYRHTQKTNAFVVVEEWKDLEAIEFHNNTPHFTGFFAEVGAFFAEPAQVKRYFAERE
jgi:quinol monooxygenase YgiN